MSKSNAQKKKLVVASPSSATTLVQMLRDHAEQRPGFEVIIFLDDNGEETTRYTFAGLDRQARAIAATLQRQNAKGERVLLVYPPGPEFVAAYFGCLYAGAIAVPTFPPHPSALERTLPRFRSIVQDAKPKFGLTPSSLKTIARGLSLLAPEFRKIKWFASDDLEDGVEREWQNPEVTADHVAFLQYTSGSTAMPKGVMVTHGNLLHNSMLIQRFYQHTPDTHAVIWLPAYHDMGLIGGILQPLYVGFQVVLMSPMTFLQRPIEWLKAMSKYKANTSGGPNFAYELCVKRIKPEQMAGLDLSSWNVAFNGAEAVRAETIEKFSKQFGPYGFKREAFYPCYGLAESTLFVTGGQRGEPIVRAFSEDGLRDKKVVPVSATSPGARVLVSSGRNLPDQTLRIVDPDTLQTCPPDRIGEIWVCGPSKAKGYWERPDVNAESFEAQITGDTSGLKFLRTGDLGFLHEGELYIAGRLKDLIIIRGKNHYPQDIELTVERADKAVRPGCVAAFSVEANGEERLVIVAELERRFKEDRRSDVNRKGEEEGRRKEDSDPFGVAHGAVGGSTFEEVVQGIRKSVAEHHDLTLYSVVLIKAGSIPKTSSGKIRRRSCKEELREGKLTTIYEWTAKGKSNE